MLKQKKHSGSGNQYNIETKFLLEETLEYSKTYLRKKKKVSKKKEKEEKILEDNFVYEPKFENYAIIYAARNNHIKLIQDLIKKGANLNIRDKNGFSPLYVAIKNNHKKILNLLFKYGAGFSIDKKTGNTYLHDAAEKQDLKMAKILTKLKFQKRNYDLNKKNLAGKTPFDIAFENKNIYMMRYLLENGAEINLDNISNLSEILYTGNYKFVDFIEEVMNEKLFCEFRWNSRAYFLWERRMGSFAYWMALNRYG